MADDRRQQLADEARALLREVLTNTQGHPWHVADVATDALLPLLVQAVAAERAAIHASYEAVADRIAQAAANPGLPESNARLLNTAAAEIRKVAAQ